MGDWLYSDRLQFESWNQHARTREQILGGNLRTCAEAQKLRAHIIHFLIAWWILWSSEGLLIARRPVRVLTRQIPRLPCSTYCWSANIAHYFQKEIISSECEAGLCRVDETIKGLENGIAFCLRSWPRSIIDWGVLCQIVPQFVQQFHGQGYESTYDAAKVGSEEAILGVFRLGWVKSLETLGTKVVVIVFIDSWKTWHVSWNLEWKSFW